ncbi:MAG: heparan-alpha-glucosaminide N-acetyltransferase domain-containing protein [Legionellaceae bacterium]|nr:heparan-alpha-glucosaminide N-acetyltransferase domain-containing protein [Legionellaceae bacterium]
MNRFKKSIPRVLSLDVFRGITIVLMIIVNSPGHPKPYGWLEHSAWNGCTLADIVFPFFIVIVGISAVLALSNLKAKGFSQAALFKKVLKRSVFIFLMGVLLNIFPYHLLDWSTLRVMGVLQRIALCYFVSASLFLTTSLRAQVLIAWGVLLAYTLMLFVLGEGVVGYVDRLLFSSHHLYTQTFDPEGLLSTLPAIASVLFGNIIGFQLISGKTKAQQVVWMCCAGALLSVFGGCAGIVLPINKSLWSGTYVLWTTGLFLFSFAWVYALIEMKHWHRWTHFFHVFGRHALLVYMLHVIFLKVQALIHVKNAAGEIVSFRFYITEVLFGALTSQNASFVYSVSYVLLWFLVLLGVDKYNGLRGSQTSS